MQPFTTLSGPAMPMIEDDINTDQIAPLQLSKGLTPDWGALLFKRQRMNADGSDNDHVLNKPQYKNPAILVANENFGCGSSRESAVWCLTGVGIRCVIARSIADIFRENCLLNGLLPIELSGPAMDRVQALVTEVDGAQPFTIDLPAQSVRAPNGETFAFEISASDKTRLLEGLDEIGLTMKHESEIVAFEEKMRASMPWSQEARDRRL